MEWDNIQQVLHTAVQAVETYLVSPWFYLQIGIIVTVAGISFAIASYLRSRIDFDTFDAALPGPLRIALRSLLDLADVIFFALLASLTHVFLVNFAVFSRGYLLATATSFAGAWIIIRLVTALIPNAAVVRAVSIAAWIVAALSIIGKLHDVMELLDSVSIPVGTVRVTPLLVIKVSVAMVMATWLVDVLSKFLDTRISRSRDLTPSVQVLLIKMVRLVLLIVAVIIVMSSAGVDLSALAIFSSAIGVGVGFGLQKIVANFISGVILLADKSVKPGDMITIGDATGRISAMDTRYISVAAGDGRAILIPNEDLITQRVVNWTYSNKHLLVKVIFATSYDADPHIVCKLAMDVATNSPNVAAINPPSCLLTDFAETGMKFALSFWVADLDIGADNVRSEVMLKLWEAFKHENIRVPYPVREIRVRGGQLPAEVAPEIKS